MNFKGLIVLVLLSALVLSTSAFANTFKFNIDNNSPRLEPVTGLKGDDQDRDSFMFHILLYSPLFAQLQDPTYNQLYKVDAKYGLSKSNTIEVITASGSKIIDINNTKAQSIKSDSFIIDLKEGVKWHDGRDFNADDVLFTYKVVKGTLQKPSAIDEINTYLKFKTLNIEEMEKVGDYKIKILTKEKLSVYDLARMLSFMYIIPWHSFIDDPKSMKESYDFNDDNDQSLYNKKRNFENRPVGTGPFVYKDRKLPDGYTVVHYLELFDNYSKIVPDMTNYSGKISKLEINQLAQDPLIKINLLITGKLDVAFNIIPNSKLVETLNDPNSKVFNKISYMKMPFPEKMYALIYNLGLKDNAGGSKYDKDTRQFFRNALNFNDFKNQIFSTKQGPIDVLFKPIFSPYLVNKFNTSSGEKDVSQILLPFDKDKFQGKMSDAKFETKLKADFGKTIKKRVRNVKLTVQGIDSKENNLDFQLANIYQEHLNSIGLGNISIENIPDTREFRQNLVEKKFDMAIYSWRYSLNIYRDFYYTRNKSILPTTLSNLSHINKNIVDVISSFDKIDADTALWNITYNFYTEEVWGWLFCIGVNTYYRKDIMANFNIQTEFNQNPAIWLRQEITAGE